MLRRWNRNTPIRHIAAVEISGAVARLAIAAASGPGAPQLISLEEIPRERLQERVIELDDEYRRSALALDWYTTTAASASQTCTTRIADDFRHADVEDQEAACLAREGFTREVIFDRDLHVRTEILDDRCFITAVFGTEFDRLARLIPAERLFVTTAATALSAAAPHAAREAFNADTELSLLVQCTQSSIAAVAIARGTVVLTHLVDLSILLAEEGVGARGPGAHVAHGTNPSELDAAQYAIALESAVVLFLRLLSELFEQPSALTRIYLTGDACAAFPLLGDVTERYGHRFEIQALQTSRCVTYVAASDADKARSREIFRSQDTNAVVFGLLALAASGRKGAIPAHVPDATEFRASRFATFSKLAASSNARAVTAAFVIASAAGLGLPYWVASSRLAQTQRDLAFEREQEKIYEKYAEERARVEAEMAHEQQLLSIIDTERAAQLVPKVLTDDIDRAFALVPGLRGSDDPKNRIELTESSWDGTNVTISGRTPYLENATNFGQALGALDERERFLDVATTHREKTLPPTEEQPEGDVSYEFTIRAQYQPAAAR